MEMTDKELLEKAAKVVGLDGYIHEWINGPEFIIPGENPATWNPLTDDGDALRLAVKIGIQIDPSDEMYVFAGRDMDATELGYCECKNDDAMAAMRRAITRAAAAMVKE